MGIETSSDRNFACFLCAKGFSKDIAHNCPRCNQPLDIGLLLEGQAIGEHRLTEYIARGYYGATYRAENAIGRLWAIKIIPAALYEESGKDFTAEIARYRTLGSHPNIASLANAGNAEVRILGKTIAVHYIQMEWIDGRPLSDFLKNPPRPLGINEVYGIALDIASGLSRFESVNLWHNDLNAQNVLVSALPPDQIETRRAESPYICQIVDTGSAVFRQSERLRTLSDLTFLGRHMQSARQAVLSRYDDLPKEDQYFLDELGTLIAHILDENPGRAIPSPRLVVDQIKTIYTRRHMLDDELPSRMEDPFGYLNANDFPDRYINLLFCGSFPWIDRILSPDPQSLLVSGPRGSGKTMILKSMRLRTKLNPMNISETPDEIQSRLREERAVGFFVSARIEIGNNCFLQKLPRWAEEDRRIIFFFNLLFLDEIIRTMHIARRKGFLELRPEDEGAMCSELASLLGLTEAIPSFPYLISVVAKLSGALLAGEDSSAQESRAGEVTFLTNVCNTLKTHVAYCRQRTILFLLDDFSMPRVPAEIQTVLLPIVWNTGGGYSFRVTAHSESVARVDKENVVFVPNRDFVEINLGGQYIQTSDEDERIELLRDAFDDIFSRRFQLHGETQLGPISSLLGAAPYKAIGREIKERSEKNKVRGVRYGGWQTVIRLCSGDIAYIIDVLGKIVSGRLGAGAIPIEVQSRQIRYYARNELHRLQDHRSPVCSLYNVALQFGRFSRFKLLNEDAVGSKEKRPAEYLRIEVELDRLSEDGQEALRELLRHGVFIDGGFSSSSKAKPARRLVFKKLFTPAFPTTYRNRDTWPMTGPHFMEFIQNPEAYVKGILSQYGVPPAQQSLALESLDDRHP